MRGWCGVDGQIVCNLCGRPFDMWDIQEDYSIHKTCGYGSRYDMETIDLHLCCDCFDKIVSSCKASPVLE